MRPNPKIARLALALAAMGVATSTLAQSVMIGGPAQIVSVTSTIPGGSGTYTLPQIADGNNSDAAPFNGFQGADGATGTITFMLNEDYDLTSFHLWNDINVRAEGVGSYTLKFYDSANALVGTAGPFTTTAGQIAPHVNTFPSIGKVRKVEMEIQSVQQKPNTFARRVEIREVAFDGVKSPVTVAVPGDHYQCYRVAKAEQLKPENIVVADQFGKSEIVLGMPVMLCNPSVKVHNGKTYGVLNQKIHQVCYTIVKQGEQQPMRRVRTANQFTTAEMMVGPRQMFCVPSYKTLLDGKEFPID
jgi:hypothetical protein